MSDDEEGEGEYRSEMERSQDHTGGNEKVVRGLNASLI